MTWAAWLVSVAGPFIIQGLIGLGVGVLTVTGIDLAVNQAMTWCTNAVGGVPSALVNILALGGFWQGFSYIGGAFSARVAMAGASSMKRFFIR
ncbi:TPA: DUF2523 domain-containing protein [Burkholderia vietnamiensis]|nr:DUF2523 domain-containing protein [Burkholderia vietnamiensis]HDR8994545.1 DUF2523 domain-containing protein [Burkholderia vietnamiensis]